MPEAENDGARNAVLHALNSQIELATAKQELKIAGLERQKQEMVERQTSPSERDIHDLMRQMRDIADHEEV